MSLKSRTILRLARATACAAEGLRRPPQLSGTNRSQLSRTRLAVIGDGRFKIFLRQVGTLVFLVARTTENQ